MTRTLFAFLLALVLLLSAGAAQAHRVNIFAWVEGGTLRTESQFSRSRKVQGGEVLVLDAADDRELARGTTDDEGGWDWPIPPEVLAAGHDLTLRLDAGVGHSAEWLVHADELGGSPAPAAQTAASAVTTKQPPGASSTPTAPGQTVDIEALAQSVAEKVAAQLDASIDSKLSAHLAPINRELAAMSSQEPGLREIVSGLGWIVGLAGIGLYLVGRRRS